MKKIVLLIALISALLAKSGLEYTKAGVECKERNQNCVIENLEKALETNDLNQNQIKAAKNLLRTQYHIQIEKNLDNWSLAKVDKSCKRAIELSNQLNLSKDLYNISFYLWLSLKYGDNNQKQKAKSFAKEAQYLLSLGGYKKGLNKQQEISFRGWANKIIKTIQKL